MWVDAGARGTEEVGVWGRRSGGRYRDRQGATRGTEGAEQETTEETAGTATEAGGRRQTTEDLPAQSRDNGAGGKYRAVGSGTEKRADNSSEREGEETQEFATEEEAKTKGGGGEEGGLLTTTAG